MREKEEQPAGEGRSLISRRFIVCEEIFPILNSPLHLAHATLSIRCVYIGVFISYAPRGKHKKHKKIHDCSFQLALAPLSLSSSVETRFYDFFHCSRHNIKYLRLLLFPTLGSFYILNRVREQSKKWKTRNSLPHLHRERERVSKEVRSE